MRSVLHGLISPKIWVAGAALSLGALLVSDLPAAAITPVSVPSVAPSLAPSLAPSVGKAVPVPPLPVPVPPGTSAVRVPPVPPAPLGPTVNQATGGLTQAIAALTAPSGKAPHRGSRAPVPAQINHAAAPAVHQAAMVARRGAAATHLTGTGGLGAVLAGILVFGNDGVSIPFLPPLVSGVARLVLLTSPAALESFLRHAPANQLNTQDNLLVLALLLIAMLAVTRLLLDVRNSARLRHAMAPAYPFAVAYAGRARRGVKVVYNDLTGVMRRVYTQTAVESAIQAARRRRDSRLVVALIDVKHPERRDDRYSAAETDTIAHGLAVSLRKEDTVFRYGGDELLCLMPRIDPGRAEQLLGDMRSRMQRGGLDFDLGLAHMSDGDSGPTLIARAETAATATGNGHAANGHAGNGSENGWHDENGRSSRPALG